MTGYMKIMAGRFVVPVLALLVMVASSVSCLGDPDKGKTHPPVKTTTDKAKDAVRQGVEKADKAVTNVVHQIGVGAHKANDVASDVAGKVKVAVTNAVNEITEAIKHATR
jgi:gas vesicle protein